MMGYVRSEIIIDTLHRSEKLTPDLRLPHCPLSKADRSMPTAHFPGVLNRLRNNSAMVSNVRIDLRE